MASSSTTTGFAPEANGSITGAKQAQRTATTMVGPTAHTILSDSGAR